MPRINLLPWREEQRQKRKKEFGLALVGALLLAAGATLGTQLYYTQQIAYQNERLRILDTEIEDLNAKIAEINQLETQKRRLLARMEVIERLENTTPEAVTLVDSLVDTIPSGTWLTEAKQQGARITLTGLAQSNARISDFMRNIDESPWIRDPFLDDIVNDGTGPIRDGRFNLLITQVRLNDDEEAQ
jgi:type IV pilus assembly protein PilN